jgi:hypothetical protein
MLLTGKRQLIRTKNTTPDWRITRSSQVRRCVLGSDQLSLTCEERVILQSGVVFLVLISCLLPVRSV